MTYFLDDSDYQEIEYRYCEKPSPHVCISRITKTEYEHVVEVREDVEEIYQDGRVRHGFDNDGDFEIYDVDSSKATMTYEEALRRAKEQEEKK